MRKLRSLNTPLVLGTLLLLGLIALLLMPAFVDLANPHLGRTTIMVDDRVRIPPVGPGEGGFVLGTDSLGRDMYSRLIYGARYTLGIGLAITLLRTVVAIPLGLLAGFLGGRLSRIVQVTGSALTAIPTLLITIMLVGTFTPFAVTNLGRASVYILMVTLVGVPRLAEVVRLRTEEICLRPHMEAAVSMGAGPMRLIRKHICPLMTGDLLVMLSSEMAWVFLMMGQLAIFHIYVGGSAGLPDLNGSVSKFQEYWPEWSMMMGYMRGHILRRAALPLLPGIALALTAACFHLLSEGMRLRSLRRVV